MQVKRVQHNEGCQWTGESAPQREEEKQSVGQSKKHETGHEGAAPAKDDGIGPDVAASIALVVPEFLGQVARGKRQGEEAGDGDAATIDHASHGVTQKEMESSTEQVER